MGSEWESSFISNDGTVFKPYTVLESMQLNGYYHDNIYNYSIDNNTYSPFLRNTAFVAHGAVEQYNSRIEGSSIATLGLSNETISSNVMSLVALAITRHFYAKAFLIRNIPVFSMNLKNLFISKQKFFSY